MERERCVESLYSNESNVVKNAYMNVSKSLGSCIFTYLFPFLLKESLSTYLAAKFYI